MENLTYQNELPQKIYHYCSIDGFMSIIKGANFRLCNVFKSNDSEEGKFLISKIRLPLIMLLRNTLEIENIDEIIKKVEALVTRKENDYLNNKYVLSFSANNDSLNHWIEYANHGTGFAIGVNSFYLQKLSEKYKENGFSFGQVNYSINMDETRREKILQVINLINNKEKEINIENTLFNLVEKLFCDVSFYKNSGFIGEKEWRLIFDHKGNINRFDETQYYISHLVNIKDMLFDEIEIKNIDYKSSLLGDNIISFYNLSFDKIKNEFIKEIIIGPKANMLVNDIDLRAFLYSNGFIAQPKGSREFVKIYKSNISYQSR